MEDASRKFIAISSPDNSCKYQLREITNYNRDFWFFDNFWSHFHFHASMCFFYLQEKTPPQKEGVKVYTTKFSHQIDVPVQATVVHSLGANTLRVPVIRLDTGRTRSTNSASTVVHTATLAVEANGGADSCGRSGGSGGDRADAGRGSGWDGCNGGA